MGETRVDLQHLLEDLRDAYSGSLEQTMRSRRRNRRRSVRSRTSQDAGGRRDLELGRLVDSTLWINDAHPAYSRAVSRPATNQDAGAGESRVHPAASVD